MDLERNKRDAADNDNRWSVRYKPLLGYSKETAGKARMHTCLDQYNANKANNANGGLNWIQKGGGYHSECNKRLKG